MNFVQENSDDGGPVKLRRSKGDKQQSNLQIDEIGIFADKDLQNLVIEKF